MPLTNDRWSATFTVDKLGDWLYTIEAWVDHFDTWCADLRKRLMAQPVADKPDSGNSQDIPLAFLSGALLLQQSAQRAEGPDRKLLADAAADLLSGAAVERQAAAIG